MKVKELIEKVNAELKDNFEKPVIKNEGYNKGYDQKNGRNVIDMYDVVRIIEKYSKGYFSTDRFNIVLYGTNLIFKTKRKASGIVGTWDYKDRKTVVEIFVENLEYLDMTIQDFIDEKNQKEARTKSAERNMYDKFLERLAKKNITIKEFKDLLASFSVLNYEYRK